jgi:hypothetical protein
MAGLAEERDAAEARAHPAAPEAGRGAAEISALKLFQRAVQDCRNPTSVDAAAWLRAQPEMSDYRERRDQ